MYKIIFSFLFLGLIAHAGQNVGNGGDAIHCKANANNFLAGTYSLDYILTLQSSTLDLDSATVRNWNESADRVSKILKAKLPTLSPYFEEYRKTIFNKDPKFRQIWETTPFGILDLKDENIKAQIPENCKVAGEAKIIQAVIRQYQAHSGTPDHIIYKYMPEVVSELDQTNPLQLSYLLIHEWLWDFSSNVERNRRFNRLLHSPRIEQMPAQDLQDYLKGMGFFIPEAQADIFDPNSCQGNHLRQQDIDDRYKSLNFTDNLGRLEFGSRTRLLHCSAERPNCQKTWREAAHSHSPFVEFPFYAAISWSDPDHSHPLKIVSPAFLNNQGISYRNGLSEIACRFIKTEKYNLECSFTSPMTATSLTGQPVTTPLKSLNKVYGVFTDECIRLESFYTRTTDTIGPAGKSIETDEQNSVLFLRSNWIQ